jgi:glutathione synthase/RimK-type ligase-like ATP-grasp enzyme
MTTINISLSKAELLFMKEAMQQKFNSWMEELDDAQENARLSTFTLNSQQVQAMKDAGIWDDFIKRMDIIEKYRNAQLREQMDSEFDKHYYAWKAVEPEEIPKPKKPHWTQTAEGKKIMAQRSKNRSKK